METAQGPELKNLVEEIRDLLEIHYMEKLAELGIQQDNPNLIPLGESVAYGLLETEEERKEFKDLRRTIQNLINAEKSSIKGKWREAYYQVLDGFVYSFFSRILSIKVMEELGLLNESTLKSRTDLSNRSARMARIQENIHHSAGICWYRLLLEDAFNELADEMKATFDQSDPFLQLWPCEKVIALVMKKLNVLNPEIYRQDDVLGWFYHYYVVNFRKAHKTMSAHGLKTPPSTHYLSILNTVYTPLWMVRTLVDNSFGHWWLDRNPSSTIFENSPYLIKKSPVKVEILDKHLEELKILDPACGSGNFLLYMFRVLLDCYQEKHPDWPVTEIITAIIEKNIYGIDINGRAVQLAILGLYILVKRLINEWAPKELHSFKIPSVNIISCDTRSFLSESRSAFLQRVPDGFEATVKEILDLFGAADQLGSLIDVQGILKEVEKTRSSDLMEIVNELLQVTGNQNSGSRLSDQQAKPAVSLASVLVNSYDFVYGNPPFGLVMKDMQQKLKNYYPDSYADLVSAFIDQSLRLLNKNGFLGMVTDHSFMHLPKFSRFRKDVLLSNSYIQNILMTGLAALPDARNVPALFILRKKKPGKTLRGLHRFVEYSSSTQFSSRVYETRLKEAINLVNQCNLDKGIPRGWSIITQQSFLYLPRNVIDLNIDDRFQGLYRFFYEYSRLDIGQLEKIEKKDLPSLHVARAFVGIQTGNNWIFIRYWYEVPAVRIRPAEQIEDISGVPDRTDKPFVPYSKGGGDIQYYSNNPYIIWWNGRSIEEMRKTDHRFQNISLLGRSHVHWSLHSGKPRGRFLLSQPGLVNDVASMGISILDGTIDRFLLLAYLNSSYASFFARLQTKSRMWQAGHIARIPVPVDFLRRNEHELKRLVRESHDLRAEWDTGHPMSPIFSVSLIDKVISPNATVSEPEMPKTGHPFCETFNPCGSEAARSIRSLAVDPGEASFSDLLDCVEKRFMLLTGRLYEIDDGINKILHGLVDGETRQALDDYYQTFVGDMQFIPERDIWLKDFLMANLIEIISSTSGGIIPLDKHLENSESLYEKIIEHFCLKFQRDLTTIQSLLDELEVLLGKAFKHWIAEDFFFYHCQRFGGRPVVWQFSSKNKGKTATMDIFIDYHKLSGNTLATIRTDHILPLFESLKHLKENNLLSEDDYSQLEEIEYFLQAFLAIERGYRELPTPNTLIGKKTQPGKGDDKTYGWVFTEAVKIIQDGYNPDLFKGVLVNILPLCLEVPDSKKSSLTVDYRYLCPKGTLKHVLKKIEALDQLRQSSVK